MASGEGPERHCKHDATTDERNASKDRRRYAFDNYLPEGEVPDVSRGRCQSLCQRFQEPDNVVGAHDATAAVSASMSARILSRAAWRASRTGRSEMKIETGPISTQR